MENNGARAFYLMLDTIKDTLLEDKNVNSVTYGDLSEVDLSKQTIFPLSHILVNSATNDSQTMSFNVTILCMDVVDIDKSEAKNIFEKHTHEHYVLNTQLAVGNRLYQLLHNGQLRLDGYQVDGEANCEPFVDRFSNNLAGWAVTFDVMVKNDLFICQS
jgi:hypothetical protein|tara:strand:+ start:6178 stop:6654 length:477 start_codon:yes stop_codon:yes gene_type:complete